MAKNSEKKIIEIGGVKLECDMRQGTLRTVESFKVGDNIKLLKKQYEVYTSHPAVIVGFDEFPNKPTIVVAYIDATYSSATELKFAYINSETKDMEICPMNTLEMVINKNLVCQQLDNAVAAKEREVVELKAKRAYFLEMFGKYFEGGEHRECAVSSGIDA